MALGSVALSTPGELAGKTAIGSLPQGTQEPIHSRDK